MAKKRALPQSSSVDAYIASAAKETQPILREIRRIVRKNAPEAEELISYRMPAYRWHGMLLYFAAFKKHIGIYPPVTGDAKLEKAFLPYAGPKGNLQIPLDQPIPYALIERIVKLRVRQQREQQSAPKKSVRNATVQGAPKIASMRELAPETLTYHAGLSDQDRAICETLASLIQKHLHGAVNKVWHAHPVWFLDENPIVGYSKLKGCIRLLFWSGQSFGEPGLNPEGSFKAAEIRYTSADQICVPDLRRWLATSEKIQWDYKNLVRRKGRLERLT